MSETSRWMAVALDQAHRAEHVSPNPAVGCVVVKDGAIAGRGFTRPPGGAHAEAVALAVAGERARGAIAYVTLEPCSHWGRTSPCVDRLIEAGVAEVRCAVLDPDPRVRGGGVARLREAGIAVRLGGYGGAVRRHLAAYITHRLTGRPLVTVKFAMSLDGKIATRARDARWVSGPATRAWTRAQRAHTDAILVGVETVLADDPQLTAREADGRLSVHQPLRVVLDSRGRTPPESRLLDPPVKTLIATTEQAPPAWREAIAARGGEVWVAPPAEGRVHLAALLDELGRRQVLTLLAEGGGAVHGAFFDANLVDRVQAIIAPLVVGGVDAPAAVGGTGVARMADARRLRRVEVTRTAPDADLIVTGWRRLPYRTSLEIASAPVASSLRSPANKADA